jgi:hypothetical protein
MINRAFDALEARVRALEEKLGGLRRIGRGRFEQGGDLPHDQNVYNSVPGVGSAGPPAVTASASGLTER